MGQEDLNQGISKQHNYDLRGYMVKPRTDREIASKAVQQFLIFATKGISKPEIERLIDHLSFQGISVHIERNHNWERSHTWLKRGESSPDQNQITLPKKVFDGAKNGSCEDLEVFFHELGHVVLRHSPIYFKDDGYIVSRMDDAEAQADFFAQVMLRLFEVTSDPDQMSLF